jgi:hypothetical protein
MKTTRLLVLGTLAGILAAVAWAQLGTLPDANAQQVVETPVVTQEQPQADRSEHKAKHRVLKASEIIGMNVRGESGDDNIGSINDLVIDQQGRVNYAAVSFGGFLGVGDKLFAVPLEAIDFVRNDEDAYARISVTEDKLKEMEGFDQDHWPDMPNKTFLGSDPLRQAERPVTDTATDADLER